MSRTAVEKRLKLRVVLRGLRRMYGTDVRRKSAAATGLDILVEAMLSQNTNMINARRGYFMLRRRFKTWAEVMAAPVGEVQREIAICGLARMRARRLINLLRTIQERHGRLSIQHLARETPDGAFEYLMGLFGIGPKTAAFTMLFGLGHPILPVDNGVLRVVRRLRVVRAKARDLEAERMLSPLIADGAHYATHVLMFRHAKERCRPRNPKCGECELLEICPHGKRVVKHQRPDRRVEVFVPLRRKPVRLAGFVSAGLVRHEADRMPEWSEGVRPGARTYGRRAN
jgi:endonuclease-3